MPGKPSPKRPLFLPPSGTGGRPDASNPVSSRPVSRVAQALLSAQEEIARSLPGGCSFKEIAQRLNMSYSHFRREFKNKTGVSPGEYLHRVRLQRTCELLESTDLMLKEIAEKLGYYSAFHLSADFKSRMGKSPSAWKKTRTRLP